MIDFILDILSDAIVTVTKKKKYESKNEAVRVLLSFYDSTGNLERRSEELLQWFELYLDSGESQVDRSLLRKEIRDFSSVVCDFVDDFKSIATALHVFEKDLALTFMEIEGGKLSISRNLIELASPDVGFDGSIPDIQQRYMLRILDYARFRYSTKALQQRWEDLSFRYGGRFSDREDFSIIEQMSNKTIDKWISTSSKKKEMGSGENFIRSKLAFKVVSFDDLAELKTQVQSSKTRLEKLRQGRESLEQLLSNNFTIKDFFVSKETIKIDQRYSTFGVGQMSGGSINTEKLAGTINESQPQTLAEAAAEIQQLLKQLEESNPTNTTAGQMAVATQAIEIVESNPTLKQRVVGALQSAGTEAFKEALDHPVANVLVAAFEGWTKP